CSTRSMATYSPWIDPGGAMPLLSRRRWLALTLLSAAACGGPDVPKKLVPVKGKMVYQNQPVKHMNFELIPDLEKGTTHSFIANGVTDEKGEFTLSTYVIAVSKSQEGVAPGFYKVRLSPYPGSPVKVPQKYLLTEETPLSVEVSDAGTDNLVLTLKDG